MSGDWEAVAAGLDTRSYRNRLGPDEVRADDPREVAGARAAAGATTLGWHGAPLFSDHWGSVQVGEDYDALVEAEEQAARRGPYRGVCALTHTLARRSAGFLPDRNDRRRACAWTHNHGIGSSYAAGGPPTLSPSRR